jgi:hypothetical protein
MTIISMSQSMKKEKEKAFLQTSMKLLENGLKNVGEWMKKTKKQLTAQEEKYSHLVHID